MTGSLARVGVHAAFAYLALLALLRLSGKRTVAQGTAFDFVFALILGDTVDNLVWGEISTATFLAAVVTLTLLHAAVSWGQSLSPRFARLVSGSPTVLLRHGQPVAAGLRSEHVAESELAELMRLWGVPRDRWSEVEQVLLEKNGQPSLSQEPPDRPASRGDAEEGRV